MPKAENTAPDGAGQSEFTGDWTFAISEDQAAVTAASVSVGDVSKPVDISDVTYTTVAGTNDRGAHAVVTVSETRSDEAGTHTSVFSDQDGDGIFARMLDLHLVAEGDRSRNFTFDSDGKVVGEDWPAPATGSHNVSYETVQLSGETYVVKTVEQGGLYTFEISRGAEAEGVWNVIATGMADVGFHPGSGSTLIG
jgi:hypothetical protein